MQCSLTMKRFIAGLLTLAIGSTSSNKVLANDLRDEFSQSTTAKRKIAEDCQKNALSINFETNVMLRNNIIYKPINDGSCPGGVYEGYSGFEKIADIDQSYITNEDWCGGKSVVQYSKEGRNLIRLVKETDCSGESVIHKNTLRPVRWRCERRTGPNPLNLNKACNQELIYEDLNKKSNFSIFNLFK